MREYVSVLTATGIAPDMSVLMTSAAAVGKRMQHRYS